MPHWGAPCPHGICEVLVAGEAFVFGGPVVAEDGAAVVDGIVFIGHVFGVLCCTFVAGVESSVLCGAMVLVGGECI